MIDKYIKRFRTLRVDRSKGAPANQYVDRSIIHEVERQMLHEPTAAYQEEVGQADEEELF